MIHFMWNNGSPPNTKAFHKWTHCLSLDRDPNLMCPIRYYLNEMSIKPLIYCFNRAASKILYHTFLRHLAQLTIHYQLKQAIIPNTTSRPSSAQNPQL